MKDIHLIITGKRQKKEIIAFIICFMVSFGLNVYAIFTYNGKAWELLTSILYVITFALALYAAWIIIRLIVCGIKSICSSHKTVK